MDNTDDVSKDVLKMAASLVRLHEGFRERPYKDSLGFLTLGFGHCLEMMPITEASANMVLQDDVDWFANALYKSVHYFKNIDPVRQAVLIDMAFNLGLIGLMKFEKMWTAISHSNWAAAADALIDSKWAVQVGARATENAKIMRTGSF